VSVACRQSVQGKAFMARVRQRSEESLRVREERVIR
jgi:hypothetical protein